MATTYVCASTTIDVPVSLSLAEMGRAGTPTTSPRRRSARSVSVLGGYNWIKEHVFSLGEVVPDSGAFGRFALVVPFEDQRTGHAALIRQSDTGIGPATVSLGV